MKTQGCWGLASLLVKLRIVLPSLRVADQAGVCHAPPRVVCRGFRCRALGGSIEHGAVLCLALRVFGDGALARASVDSVRLVRLIVVIHDGAFLSALGR